MTDEIPPFVSEERKGKPSLYWLFGSLKEEESSELYEKAYSVTNEGHTIVLKESDPVSKFPQNENRRLRVTYLFYQRGEYVESRPTEYIDYIIR